MIRIAALFLIAMTLTSCASTPAPARSQLRSIADAGFPGKEPNTLWVPSSSPFSAMGRIARLSAQPSNADPALVGLLQSAVRAPVALVVSGDNSGQARQEIIAALSQVKGNVEQLELMFIGDAADAAEVRRAVEARGGKYVLAK